MNIPIKKLAVLIICSTLLFISGCVEQAKNFSYESIVSTTEPNISDDLSIHSYFLSFNTYLFEFNVRVTKYDSILGGSNQIFRRVEYDTLSLFVLAPDTRMYYEFNTFDTNNKLIASGPFSKKPAGMRLLDTVQKSTESKYEITLKDTMLWNQKLYYFSEIQKDRSNQDSVLANVFFLKEKNFTSLYDLMTTKFVNPSFSMVGFSYHYIEQKIVAQSVLKNLRPLTSKEEAICSSIVKKIPKK